MTRLVQKILTFLQFEFFYKFHHFLHFAILHLQVNRQICLSWLKATYETTNVSCSIEQQVMYKQYLASLHKLGKKDVISAQHYAVCVR